MTNLKTEAYKLRVDHKKVKEKILELSMLINGGGETACSNMYMSLSTKSGQLGQPKQIINYQRENLLKHGGVRNSKRSKHLFLKLIIKPGNNDYVQRSEIVAAEVSAIPTANKCNSSILFFKGFYPYFI